jgi:hypothetical protein
MNLVTHAMGYGISARETGMFVARICFWLFAEREVRERDLLDHLPGGLSAKALRDIETVSGAARHLRMRVSMTEGPQRWDFHHEVGVPLDEIWQERWFGSEIDGVVEFVVAPAYVVSDAVFVRQRVFTSSAVELPSATGAVRLS